MHSVQLQQDCCKRSNLVSGPNITYNFSSHILTYSTRHALPILVNRQSFAHTAANVRICALLMRSCLCCAMCCVPHPKNSNKYTEHRVSIISLGIACVRLLPLYTVAANCRSTRVAREKYEKKKHTHTQTDIDIRHHTKCLCNRSAAC